MVSERVVRRAETPEETSEAPSLRVEKLPWFSSSFDCNRAAPLLNWSVPLERAEAPDASVLAPEAAELAPEASSDRPLCSDAPPSVSCDVPSSSSSEAFDRSDVS